MSSRWPLVALMMAATFVCLAQRGSTGRRWQMYEREMQNPADDPPDAWEEAEFAFARLRFRSQQDGYRRGHARWGTDANTCDRHFIVGLRRLTRVNARSVEHIVDIDDDEMFNWPWMYAVGIGDWYLTDAHVARLRKYFDRGGFLVVDDFHGEREWRDFANGVNRIYPGRQMVELQDEDSIFHVVYDLRERFQVSGLNIVYGNPYERGGYVPHWRALKDESGRVQIAAFFNQDLGDACEWAYYPPYPEKLSGLAWRMGVNYVLYSMTH